MNTEITIDQILKLSKPELISNLINAGLTHEQSHEAFFLFRDSLSSFIQAEMEGNRMKNLILILTGYSWDHSLIAPAVVQYAMTLSSHLHIDYNIAQEVAKEVIPSALQSVGDHLPWSNLNKQGLTSLIRVSKVSEPFGSSFKRAINQATEKIMLLVSVSIGLN
jgi:hypothetical protein